MEKKEIVLSINPCIFGLNYHDPAVAIISEGKILFGIEEERINGVKGSKGIFPTHAVKVALTHCGCTEDDITKIAVAYDPCLWKKRLDLEMTKIIYDNIGKNTGEQEYQVNSEEILRSIIRSELPERYSFFSTPNLVNELILSKVGKKEAVDISFYEHHLSHVASSYEVSGFKHAVGIVVDGIGEAEATTIWEIHNHEYRKIMQINYPNSLGYFYAVATKFLGFEPWQHEGKTMALAAYGHENKEICDRVQTIIDTTGSFYDVSNFVSTNSADYLMLDEDAAMQSIAQKMGFPPRGKEDPVSSQYIDFAWAVQNVLEKSIIELINWAIQATGITNVCAAGGVFMNCKMNMVVRENSLAKNYFVQPLAGDAGLVIGAGLLASKSNFKGSFSGLNLGPEYSDEEIEAVLCAAGVKYRKADDLAYEVAQLIAQGKIVGWFEGRMEMGARALGSRSILADPRDPNMSDRINHLIKHREKWRPFACSVLEDSCDNIFENYDCEKAFPFMIEAFKVKEAWVKKIPAVVHRADGTSRPQTVNKNVKPLYYGMINHFKDITGCPLVLNTSFNDKGQPIVMSPELAVDFYKRIPIDVLAIGSFLVERSEH